MVADCFRLGVETAIRVCGAKDIGMPIIGSTSPCTPTHRLHHAGVEGQEAEG